MAKDKFEKGSVLNKNIAPVEELAREAESKRPFTKVNFIMMGVCLALIVIGFLLMSGGGSKDPNVFNPDIFSARRIVVGPTLAFLGFLFMAFAIIWTPKKRKRTSSASELKSGK